ncbi:MAG: hypothetical protein AB1810_09725 [Pseudomonadota bacterium]
MPDPTIERMFERVREYQAAGNSFSHAFGLASLELRIESLPQEWGNELLAVIYGDFQPPVQDLVFDALGIIVLKVPLEAPHFRAMTALQAKVRLGARSVAAIKDAARRLNILTGILSHANRGAPVRWWSSVTNPGRWGIPCTLGEGDPGLILSLVQLLPADVQQRVSAALYWKREPRGLLSEVYRADELAVYAGYWNAFECLVDAVCLLVPPTKLSSAQKTEAIAKKIEENAGRLSASEVADLYNKVVNPGLRYRARHALNLCAADRADYFMTQCFECTPDTQRLYNLRNWINHGKIDVDDPQTYMLINERFSELYSLVYATLNGLLFLNLALQVQQDKVQVQVLPNQSSNRTLDSAS